MRYAMERITLRLGDPLPRPRIECLELDALTHTMFWHQMLRDFDWHGSRVQSQLLYYNQSAVSNKGSSNDYSS
jgi:hypothetical protein